MIEIGGKRIGKGESPFIIAEMSGNHNQSLERALSIVDAAADAGCQAIKLQTYTARTMTIDSARQDFLIKDNKSPWYGRRLYELYEEAHTPWEWHEEIFSHARKRGLICFSTPFDETAVDFLEELDTPAYKIASFENTYPSLIKKAARTGKPLIISSGLATIAELSEAVDTARENGCKDLIVLKCTSDYPASAESSNLKTIPHMAELFGCEVGLSDHTEGIGVALAAVALGAGVIEKHFTLSRADGGVDSAFSLEPAELKQLVKESNAISASLGSVQYGPTESERGSMIFRRSIYATRAIKAGEKFSEKNIRVIRPGFGLAPKYFDLVLGRQASVSIQEGEPLSWTHLH